MLPRLGHPHQSQLIAMPVSSHLQIALLKRSDEPVDDADLQEAGFVRGDWQVLRDITVIVEFVPENQRIDPDAEPATVIYKGSDRFCRRSGV